MSKVKNEAKIKNPLIVAIREQLEHRATWLWLLCDEAEKRGLDPEISVQRQLSAADLCRVRILFIKERPLHL